MSLKQPLLESIPHEGGGDQLELLGVHRINMLFPLAANVSLLLYILLLCLIYSITNPDQWAYLPDTERHAAFAAFLILLVSNILGSSRFVFQRKFKRHMSGIVYASMLTQGIAMTTNLMLAFLPTLALVDPVTHSRVFLIRWCEWIPLAGLMTFLSEGVGISKATNGVKKASLASIAQSLSCVSGIVFPFCSCLSSWLLWLTFSLSTFLSLFPRVRAKWRLYLEATNRQGSSFVEKEELCRYRYSFLLMLICSLVWAVLVLLYFLNILAHHYLRDNRYMKIESLAMVLDTAFDVLAKAIYLKLVNDVHFAVFDSEGRAQRQLHELRNLISVLWDASSDAIVISARQGDKVTSLLSPSFLKLIDVTLPANIADRKGVALMIETERFANTQNPQEGFDVISGAYVDCFEVPLGGLFEESILAEISTSTARELESSGQLIAAAWEHAQKSQMETILVFELPQRQCEVKVSPHRRDTFVAIVRDVTERYMRIEAERKAHQEAAARQRDAQSVRHLCATRQSHSALRLTVTF